MEPLAPPPRSRLLRPFIIGAGLVLVAAVTLIIMLIVRPPKPLPFDKSFIGQAAFPLYYATPLPARYTGQNSHGASFSNHVLSFAYTDGAGHQIAVTEQAKPDDFDFSQLKGDKSFQARYGKAVYRISDSQTTASLLTEGTWILVNSPAALASADIETLLNNFRPADK